MPRIKIGLVVMAIERLLPNPAWSSLRTLGQSRLLSLTVLFPFVGWLILFNQQVVSILTLIPELFGSSTQETTALGGTLVRLYFTYFGLSFLGIGSFIFIVLCPQEIKKDSSVNVFIGSESPVTTAARSKLLISYVAEDYMRSAHETARGAEAIKKRAYPSHLYDLFNGTFNEMYRSLDDDDDIGGPELGLVSMMDQLIIDNLAEKLWAARRVERVVVEAFAGLAETHKTDLLALRYIGLDYASPLVRLSIAACYSIGFFLLFVPTALTFLRIWSKMFG